MLSAKTSRCLPGVCAELLGFLALQGGQVLLQSLQEAARGLEWERKGEEKVQQLSLYFIFNL